MVKKLAFLFVLSCFTGWLAPSTGLAQDTRVKLGPAGGDGGKEFADMVLPKGARIIGVKIRSGGVVDGLGLLYKTADGKQESLGWHGGKGGGEDVFMLEDGEVITGIAGKAGGLIDSVQIITNKRTSKSYGGGGGKEFEFKGEEVVGFHGRSGLLLDQLGIFVTKK